ncbi:hypothetical protein NEMBOFW57_000658 [Staphylotrichum longicolle]|uniref:Alcohol dehydrogenase n=1 Tax=Staphylotrichum longicolle TaxID=669026 RepID=A0AAD4I1W7_9PEZI|nr:hypothetical protein NEMBOFW57_000658 [Staphylotrichum longicolle]
MSDLPETMKAVVFHGPKQIAVEDRPVPKRKELHVFRGHQPSPTGFIMGHEFVGTVVQTGSEVTSVSLGDKVVAPFTVSCMECFYCTHNSSSRCAQCLLGSPGPDAREAEYIDDRALILMADIFPTGLFGAKSAFGLLEPQQQPASDATVVVIGCGPVGLCAIVSALEYKPKHVFAVDSVPSRLELAKGLGAEPLNFLDGKDKMVQRVKEVTEGRGADAVIEVVGLSPALRTAFDLIRPFGVISSIGVHNAEIPWNGNEAYGKNVRVQMGRCPVRSMFPEALAVLARNQDKFSFMFDKIMPLSEAVEGYDLFDQMKVQKVIFKP